MESLAFSASKQVDPSQLENFHELLHGYTDVFFRKTFYLLMTKHTKFWKTLLEKAI